MYSNIVARLFSMYVSIENKPVSSKTSSETGYSHVPSSKGGDIGKALMDVWVDRLKNCGEGDVQFGLNMLNNYN